ncbi:signal transduction histidine kinase [Undibacterium sp. GrIS 1.8]|uniref:sensor histidine kinase n=1 Tax=Undibacterium sp. GrIS 1.8 TaxID=3143934 RepID=UPI003397B88A
MDSLLSWIITSEFMPHGHCYLWTPSLLWLYVASDTLTGISYYSIPLALIFFVRRRHDLEFNWIFIMFSAFIFACGTTHLISILTIWEPAYWLDASVKGFTAVLSVVTAVMLWRLMPTALKIPSTTLLNETIKKLESEVARRGLAERNLTQLNKELDAQVIARTQKLTETNEMLLLTQQNLEKKIQEVTVINQELNNFTYVASHDLKSPLRGIDQLANWISEDLADTLNPDTQRHLYLIRSRIQRMEMLLDDLLAYARVGRADDEIVTVDTRVLVSDIFELLKTSGAIRLEAADDLPTVQTRKVPLNLVLRNLISNAIKHHNKPDGRIFVGAKIIAVSVNNEANNRLNNDANNDANKGIAHYIEFTVKDDGPGIAPEHQQRVFGMFQTLKPRDEVEGSGIGLALVKKAVESVGGTVQLVSDGQTGCTFRFLWPVNIT